MLFNFISDFESECQTLKFREDHSQEVIHSFKWIKNEKQTKTSTSNFLKECVSSEFLNWALVILWQAVYNTGKRKEKKEER